MNAFHLRIGAVAPTMHALDEDGNVWIVTRSSRGPALIPWRLPRVLEEL